MRSAIVTGAAGFLGSHLSRSLVDKGFYVVGIDDFSTGSPKNISHLQDSCGPNQFKFIQQDITENWAWAHSLPEEVRSSLKYIFHFASPASPAHYQKLSIETLRANTVGLENCILFADQYRARVIFASTSEVYGNTDISPQSEVHWGHVNSFGERSCYNEAKRCGEAIIYSYNRRNNTQHGLVRIFNTYGPRMNPEDGRVVINFLVQALKKQSLTIYGNGLQTRSFCYVDDLIAGIIAYAEKSLCFPLNLGNPEEFTILELADLVKKISRNESLEIVYKKLPADDPQTRRPNISLAKKHLDPWQPKVPLHDGLRVMMDWLASTI